MATVPLWTDEFLVGSHLIDMQHKRLLILCSQLLRYCSDESHAELPLLLEEFEWVARMHFETEEVLLAKNNCPTLESHRAEHATYLAQLAELRRQVPIQLMPLCELLSAWMSDHLFGMDVEDKRFLQDSREWVAHRAEAMHSFHLKNQP
jgi:hemerythrin-like metal-binding protein